MSRIRERYSKIQESNDQLKENNINSTSFFSLLKTYINAKNMTEKGFSSLYDTVLKFDSSAKKVISDISDEFENAHTEMENYIYRSAVEVYKKLDPGEQKKFIKSFDSMISKLDYYSLEFEDYLEEIDYRN